MKKKLIFINFYITTLKQAYFLNIFFIVSTLIFNYVFFTEGSSLLWIYKKDEDITKAVSEHPDKPEFDNSSSSPFYHVPCGSLSHYGDQILPIPRSLAG